MLDDAEKLANEGNFTGEFDALHKALEGLTRNGSLGDKAILEDHLAVYYFTQGRLEDAKSQWLNSLSDATASANLTLQADVLVALATLQQVTNHLPDALQSINRALDLARKAKSPYMQSRVLGELSRLQQLAGKQSDARSSIAEALSIDHSNGYDWEAGHLLYLANINVVESKVEKAIEIGTASRNLATAKNDYLVFVQTSLFLGQGLVRTGHVQDGIRLIELSQKGLLDENKAAFKNTDAYIRTASSPYLKVVFEEALASAYDSTNRPDDALKHWLVMYDSALMSGFDIAAAESSKNLADHFQARKDINKAIEYYAKAADAFSRTGNILCLQYADGFESHSLRHISP